MPPRSGLELIEPAWLFRVSLLLVHGWGPVFYFVRGNGLEILLESL